MSNDKAISTLNNLIETCKDGEEGFRTCAEDIKRSDLKPFFNAAAERCREAAAQLQAERRSAAGGAIGPALHRSRTVAP